MGLTLGMNAAVSGLLTNQKGLDVISQNIVNVNTPGYVRKVMTPESVSLVGSGAGVQAGAIVRTVDEGLMKDIRAQASTQGSLDTAQTYYPRIEDLFGQVGDNNSIAAQIQTLQSAFQSLSGQITTPALQSAAVQAATTTANQLSQMTSQLQQLRLTADRGIQDTVTLVNQQLSNIADLNQQIVRGSAVGADVGDLQDKRDTALTTLSGYMDIQYFPRGDGSVGVYTASGKTLVDKTAGTLTHSATTITDSWMTAAGGNFNKIALNSTTSSPDITSDIGGGQLQALINMRDTVIPNLQAQMDELAQKLKTNLNQINNAGTAFPTPVSQMNGTRQFMDINNPTLNAVAIGSNGTYGTSVTADGSGTADSTHLLTSLVNKSTGASLGITVGQTFTVTNGTGTATFTVGAGSTLASLQTFLHGQTLGGSLTRLDTAINGAGQLAITTVGGVAPADNVTISGTLASELGFGTSLPAGGGVAGTAVASTALSSSLIPTGLAQSAQKIWLSGNDDTTIALFDSSGNQIAATTLRTLMASTAYNDASGNPTSLDISSTPSPPGVTITDVAAKVQNWLKAQTYQGNPLINATASLATGKLNINTGNSSVSLAFRDQTATAAGSTATDARVNFDVNGDGKVDQTVSGFSNFFGLNDMFTSSSPNSISDSNVLPADFTTPASTARSFSLLDPSGQIGNTINVPPGTSLQGLANLINAQTQTNESSVLNTNKLSISSLGVVQVSDANGTICTVNVPTTATNLTDIAQAIDAVGGSVQAKVVQDATGAYQLRVWDSRGVPLNVNVTGGTMGSSNLSSYLGMQQTHLVQATVIPDGSGYRLRIRQTNDKELYVGATPDTLTPPGSIITDMGLHASATRSAGNLAVRTDLQGTPALISRGTMQYNSDTGQYYLSSGDNTTTLAMISAMGAKNAMSSAGDITAGSYSFAEYASAIISVVSTNASHSKDQQTYQTTLGQSLNKQYTSYSGVNLDEEVSNMINFQQAYSASAKVISTLQEMLDTLVNIIH